MTTLERFDALREQYLRMARRNNLTEATQRNYHSTTEQLRNFLLEREKNGKIGEDYVSFDDIQAWDDDMVEAGNTPSTRKQRLVVAGQFFGFCTKPYISADLRYPFSPVSPDFYPKVVTKQIPEILPDEAIMELWKYEKKYRASNEQFARNYALVILMLTTGLRNKEVLDVRLSDLDFAERELTVTNGKGRKSRIVDMPEICTAALENYLRSGARPSTLSDNDFLFGTTAEHRFGKSAMEKGAEKWHRGTTAWLSQLIERHVLNQTGISGCRSHDLRHLFARISLNATGNLAELQSLLGHSDPKVSERYSGRLMQRRKRDSARSVLAARDAAAEQLRQQNRMGAVIALHA